MATIQEQARQVLKAAGWRMESKLGRGKEKWSKPGIAKKVYIGTHGSIRIGENLAQSYCQVGVNKLAAKLSTIGQAPEIPQQYKAGMFHYCSYWQTWGLVLSVDGYHVTELSLTPINPTIRSSWSQVGNVKTHCTSLERGDRITDQLPEHVLHSMYDNLGVLEADELLDQAQSLVA
jgi:hypothetical protein